VIRIVAAALIVAGALACNGDPGPKQPAEPTSAAPPAPASASAPARGAALPADQQCLPARICARWAGCVLVARGARGWAVVSGDEFPAGERVEVGNLCPGSTACNAATGQPKGAPCVPLRTPILVQPPPYTCEWNGVACARKT
jgi:hypothetical protein